MKQKIIRLICFLCIFLFLSLTFQKIFSFKYGDGIQGLTTFYEQSENSIDLMCFGSSHIFQNVNTGILWDEYGIAAYDLCGSIQPLWNTYYYMKEALKTQLPKVMIVDMYTAIRNDEYSDPSRIIKNNYGLKLSMDKINSIKISAPEEMWITYFLEYPTYHSRYSELAKSDFLPYSGFTKEYWKGFATNFNTTQLNRPGVASVTDASPLSEKNEEYLLKIIQLSKEHNIPLLLIVSPYQLDSASQQKFNRVAQIAAEQDIPFINYNLSYDEIGLDFQSDFADNHHLNHRGNVKFTRYLAAYLKNHYEIPDKRGNENYHLYDLMATDCRQRIYSQELKEIPDIGTYLEKAQNENYLIVYTISGDYKNLENYQDVKEELALFGVNLDETESDSTWILQNNELLFSSGNERSYTWHNEIGEAEYLTVSAPTVEGNNPDVYINYTKYAAVDKGLNLMIYDTFTQSFVDSVGFSISENRLSYEVYRK